MTIHISRRAVVLLLCVLPTIALARFTPTEWEFMRPITTPSQLVGDGYVRVNVDRTVSGSAQASLADLRIVGEGETPYQLVVESKEMANEFVGSTLTDVSKLERSAMFILDLGATFSVHDHLRILSSSKNFKRPVLVYAADSRLTHASTEWRLLSNESVIYNFYDKALGFDVGKGDVYYPENTSRYLRVVIGAGEGADIAVSGAEVSRILTRDAKLNTTAERATITENTKERTTEITVDLGTRGLSTHRLTLSTNETKNFNRRAVIQGSNNETTWESLGQGYVFSLKTPLFTGTELAVNYRESQMRFLRVIVFNNDDQPIRWDTSVLVSGVARTLVFEAKQGIDYVLYYGNKMATAPQYDLARFFAYIDGAQLPEATLGATLVNPLYVAPEAPVVPFTERNSGIINAVLVLLVAVVTTLLISHLKKLKLTKPKQ